MKKEKFEKLTIVVPCYNEEKSVDLFYNELDKISQLNTFNKVLIEMLFVDDGSSDNTLEIIKNLANKNDNVKYLSFSRNFGKEAAIYAGLENAVGDYVALMDVDLQDPPNLLEEMYLSITNENYDCIASKRVTRKGEPFFRSYFSKKFYKFFNKISDTKIVDGSRDFRLMTRQMVEAIISVKEYNRFSKGLLSWVGFKIKWISYENVERIAGGTKWSFWDLFLYSINGIIAFSVAPLAISSILGVLISFVSFLGIILIVIKTLLYGDPVSGWPSIASIIGFIGGLQLLCLGIIGQYLSKTYMESKRRPIYILKEWELKHGNNG